MYLGAHTPRLGQMRRGFKTPQGCTTHYLKIFGVKLLLRDIIIIRQLYF